MTKKLFFSGLLTALVLSAPSLYACDYDEKSAEVSKKKTSEEVVSTTTDSTKNVAVATNSKTSTKKK